MREFCLKVLTSREWTSLRLSFLQNYISEHCYYNPHPLINFEPRRRFSSRYPEPASLDERLKREKLPQEAPATQLKIVATIMTWRKDNGNTCVFWKCPLLRHYTSPHVSCDPRLFSYILSPTPNYHLLLFRTGEWMRCYLFGSLQ